MKILGITFQTKAELRYELAQTKRKLQTAENRRQELEEAIKMTQQEYDALHKDCERAARKVSAHENTINQLRQANDILRTKLAKYEQPKKYNGKYNYRGANGRFTKQDKAE